jgi:hypothetical protein
MMMRNSFAKPEKAAMGGLAVFITLLRQEYLSY